VNLVIVGGVIDAAQTGDREEEAECEKMHRLIKELDLRVRGGVGGWGSVGVWGCGFGFFRARFRMLGACRTAPNESKN